MSKFLLSFSLIFLSWVVPVSAQLTLSFPELLTDPDDEIEVDMTVQNFTDIITLQFTMRWNPEVLQYLEIRDTNLMAKTGVLINDNDVAEGFFRFYWFESTLTGESLEDGDNLIKVAFKVIGEKGDTSYLDISDDPMPFIAGDAHNSGAIPTARNNGMVIVQLPDGIQDPVTYGDITLYQNTPNPFRENTQIQFDLTESKYITFTLYDLLGKKITEHTQLYSAGSQYITLEQHQLPSAGTYLYQIQADNYLLTKKMNLVR